jgi:hypothetical protein
VTQYLDRSTLLLPFMSAVLVVADKLLLLGIDGNDRLAFA